MSFDTPILLIVFNRPEKTQKLFDIIKKLKPKKLFVAADGPRDKETDIYNCREVRKIFDDIEFNCDIHKRFNIKNDGLKKNVKNSIDWFFSKVEKGIILEDDCMPSLSFFNFCQELLDRYEKNEKIMQINGTNLGIDYSKKVKETYFFSKLNHVWGWASWRRAWNKFDHDFSNFLENESKNYIKEYYENDQIYEWMKVYFEKAIDKTDNIWSTYWSYSIFKNDGICITPVKNLVQNIGFDGSGTSGKSEIFKEFSDTKIHELSIIVHPKKPFFDINNDRYMFEKKIKKIDPRASILKKIKEKIKKFFNG